MISVDLFAGGGGASLGLHRALGKPPLLAVNHCRHAIRTHAANHPTTIHRQESVLEVDPWEAIPRHLRRRISVLWASPDCTHFSRARGGKPRKKEIRGLAWEVIRWASELAPRVIALENVAEFLTWGPLKADGRPDPARKGETFQEFISRLQLLGYKVEWRILRACDYGAPTSRERLFVLARCDGEPIRWPEPTHGPGRPLPHRTAAEVIDWTIPSCSIFATPAEAKAWAKTHKRGLPKRPLAEATMRRIAAGVRRYVLDAADPFLVRIGHQSSDSGKVQTTRAPLTTITSKNEHILVSPSLIQMGYGERKGQAPRILDIQAPLGTIVGGGNKHALVSAFLAKHYTGVVGQEARAPLGSVTAIDHHSLVTAFLSQQQGRSVGRDAGEPLSTITEVNHHALVAASLTKFQQNSVGQDLGDPLHTVLAGAQRFGMVASFLTKYHGQGSQAQGCADPLHTIDARARYGLVSVVIGGEEYILTDIAMRMLEPHELAAAQGFPKDYILTGTKARRIAQIGNSVPPQVVEAVVSAQFPGRLLRRAG